MSESKILIQGTAEWDQPIATNQHYMVRELAKAFPVAFVASLGLRRPELTPRDLKRIVGRLTSRSHSTRPGRTRLDNVSILSPTVVPIHQRPWTYLNRAILSKAFRAWLRHDGQRVYWTYSPVTYGFEDYAQLSIYHCVDLYGEFPGIDSDLIDRSERRLAAKGVPAIGSSEVVVAHLKRQGFKKVHYWPNVADTETIRATARESVEGQRSGAIFCGNLSAKKVDFEALGQLLDAGVELHLAGPIAEGGGESGAEVNRLISAGARYHGVLDLHELSTLMLRCKVGLIPYQLNSYTLGVSPLKTYEYLAAGLSVVSSALPGVTANAPHVYRVDRPNEFLPVVVAQLATDDARHVAERVALAESHSWTHRGEQARSLVIDGLAHDAGVTR